MRKMLLSLLVIAVLSCSVFATITNESSKISYVIDGTSEFTYSYTFDIISPGNVYITFFDTDGEEVTAEMVRTTDSTPAANEYHVDETNGNIVIGGTGTLQTQYETTITQLLITRTVDATQESAFPTATSLQSTAIETALDKNVLLMQQINEEVSRAIRIPSQDQTSISSILGPANERAGKSLGFDSGGNVALIDSGGNFSTTNAFWDDVITKSPWVDVRAFLPDGFVLDGSVDYTTELRAAYNSLTGYFGSDTEDKYNTKQTIAGVRPVLNFPTGVFLVSGSINSDVAINYAEIRGNGAVLIAANSTVEFFNNVSFDVLFSGLQFRGGKYGIEIDLDPPSGYGGSAPGTGTDGERITISHCKFTNQDYACIWSEGDNSMIINITDCVFQQSDNGQTVGALLHMAAGDGINVSNCWMRSRQTAARDYAIYNGGAMYLKNILGVADSDLTCWIENRSALYVENFRFGGESGGADALVNHYGTGSLTIKHGPAFVNNTSATIIKFYGLPGILFLSGLGGLTVSEYLYFDDDIGYEAIQTYVHSAGATAYFEGYGGTSGAGTFKGEGAIGRAAAKAVLMNSNLIPPANEQFAEADLVISDWIVSGSATWTGASFTVGQVTDTDDRGIAGKLLTATGDGQSGTYRTDDIITLANGFVLGDVYTLIWEVEVIEADQPLTVLIDVAWNRTRSFVLTEGHHLLHIPFVYLNNSGAADANLDNLDISAYAFLDEDSMRWGRITILKGNRTVNTVAYKMEGSSVPTGSQYYALGDVCYDTSPDSGGLTGWICTSAGSSAIWSHFGSLETAVVDINSVEIQALAADQFELVAAPGANMYREFVSATLILDNGTNYDNAASDGNLVIRFTDGDGVVVSASVEADAFIDATADTIARAIPITSTIVAASASVNKALVLDNDGDEYTTGTGVLRVITTYRTHIALGL